MRELLTHSLRPLAGALLFIFILIHYFACIGYGLPLPIGALSDYGNVLDRHGREKINNLIEDASLRYGIEVSILASWENPYDSVERYTYEIQHYWGLDKGNTILAVFVKEGRNWQVKVAGGSQVRGSYPNLAQFLESGMKDLVDHRRVAEAMVALFSQLDGYMDPTNVGQEAGGHTSNRGLWVTLLIVGATGAAFFVSRRICPRCGRLLHRRTRPSIELYKQEDVVYYCRHCGYTRIVTKKRGPRGRGG